MRPFRQSAGKNQKPVHQKKHPYKEPNLNDVMFFAHVVSPENDLKNQQGREGYDSPRERPLQKTRVLHVRESLGLRRQSEYAHPAMIQFHQRKHSDGRKRSREQPQEPGGTTYALPKHSEQYGTEQRRDEESEQRLHVIHDAGKAHRQIGCS